MERNEIKKALECCKSPKLTKCDGCPREQEDGHCMYRLMKDALALITEREQSIKELTEENERLRAEVNKLDALSDEMGVDIDVKLKTIFELEDKLKAEKADVMYFKDQIRADTVRKMQERLIYTLCINNEENTDFFDYAYTLETIDQIAKEMVEGANEN